MAAPAAFDTVSSLKFAFKGEIRRVGVASLDRDAATGLVTVHSLRKAVRGAFPALKSTNFCLQYKDEDGDVITVTKSKHELDEAFRVAAVLNLTVLKFEVSAAHASGDMASDDEKETAPPRKGKGAAAEEKPKPVVSTVVHKGVICDGCGVNPIVGDRFKCSTRRDFDLCSACEATTESPWPFLKIKAPAQCPASILTVLRPCQPVPPGGSAGNGAVTGSSVAQVLVDAVRSLERATGDTVEPAVEPSWTEGTYRASTLAVEPKAVAKAVEPKAIVGGRFNVLGDEPKVVHRGVTCDKSGMCPITGPRFHIPGNDYDLCASEFAKLPEAERLLFVEIAFPGATPVPCFSAAVEQPALAAVKAAAPLEAKVAEPLAKATPAAESKDADEAKGEAKGSAGTSSDLVYKLDGEALGSVRIECLAAVKEFGPFVALRKTNGTLVLRSPLAPTAGPDGKAAHPAPWKLGGCLRLGKGGVDLGGNGGPWASFHLVRVDDMGFGGGGGGEQGHESVFGPKGPRPVRILCANRKLALAAVAGNLVGVPAPQRGPHTVFRIHPCLATLADEEAPEWAALAAADEAKPLLPKQPSGAAAEEESVVTPPAPLVSVSEDEALARLLSAEWNGDEMPPAALTWMTTKPLAAPKAAFVEYMDRAARALFQPPLNPAAGAWGPPKEAPKEAPKVVPKKALAACFIADVTFPDGAVVGAGEVFSKVWRLRNDGDAPFPASVRLSRADGPGHAGPLECTSAPRKPVPCALPLEEVDAEVTLIAPLAPGRHVGYWRLEDGATGEPFGHRLWVDVHVLAKEATEAKAAEEVAVEAVAVVAAEAADKKPDAVPPEQSAAAADEFADAQDEAIAPLVALSAPSSAEPPVLPPPSPESPCGWEMAELVDDLLAEEATPVAEVTQAPAPAALDASADLGATVEGLLEADAVTTTTVGRWDDCDEGGCDEANEGDELLLSASLEGAALAGSQLDAAGLLEGDDLSESVSAALTAHVQAKGKAAAEAEVALAAEHAAAEQAASAADAVASAGPWGPAVGRLVEMGFTNVPAMVAALEKHCGRRNFGGFEGKAQEVVTELLSAMAALP